MATIVRLVEVASGHPMRCEHSPLVLILYLLSVEMSVYKGPVFLASLFQSVNVNYSNEPFVSPLKT